MKPGMNDAAIREWLKDPSRKPVELRGTAVEFLELIAKQRDEIASLKSRVEKKGMVRRTLPTDYESNRKYFDDPEAEASMRSTVGNTFALMDSVYVEVSDMIRPVVAIFDDVFRVLFHAWKCERSRRIELEGRIPAAPNGKKGVRPR